MSSPATSPPLLTLAADFRTHSSSGNAFSVKRASGKFNSPNGHEESVQSERRYSITLSICSNVSESAKDGMMGTHPLPGPPSWIVARQSKVDSRELPRQSEKSGNCPDFSKPSVVSGCPFPPGP